MPLRSDWSELMCPVGRALDVVGDPWMLVIMRDALLGRTRFDEFRESLGIADAVLSRRLRQLVDDGLLRRAEPAGDDVDGRTRHVYLPTQAGADLLPVIQSLAIWAEKHTPIPEGGAHMALIHETCGAETTSGETCSACGEPLRADDMSWDEPWKARRVRLVGAR